MILASVQAETNAAQLVVAAQVNAAQVTVAPQVNPVTATVQPTTGTAPPTPPNITDQFPGGGQVVALSHAPAPGSLRVLVNGLEYFAGDWDLNGQVLTLLHPQTDPADEITAAYQEA